MYSAKQTLTLRSLARVSLTESDSEVHNTDEDGILPTNRNVCEDGLNYIAGWMAKKLRKKCPELGSYTYAKSANTWVNELSLGGLTEPTEDFNKKISILENEFQKYCKKGVPKCPGIKKKLVLHMEKKVGCLPNDEIELFIRRRLIMRVKFLNKQKVILGKEKQKKKIKKVSQ